jgi:enterochelin esterase-like enzyme
MQSGEGLLICLLLKIYMPLHSATKLINTMRFKKICTGFIWILCLFPGCKQEDKEATNDFKIIPVGTLDTKQVIHSDILNRDMHYSVYMPPGYDTSKVSYPVLYLLHGMWGNYLDWVNNGMANTLDDAIYQKKAKPMIVIMPDGLDSFYCNNYNGGTLRYEDFLTDEFFHYIETSYRIKASRTDRAIAGLSMGGYGAVFHAFKRQEMFGSCYSMSGAFSMGASAPDLKTIINSKTTEELKTLPEFTMECGTEDPLVYPANVDFDKFLSAQSINHTFIARKGVHDWIFWNACLPEVVEFVSKYFSE